MVRIPPPDSNLVERREILDQAGIARALRRMAYEMIERNAADTQRPLYLVGVRTGGAFLAQRLCALMSDPKESHASPPPLLGAVDISLYRDDVFHGLPKPEIGPTELPAAIEGQTIILVDDVLYTGRTIRAAMDVLADYGRPRSVQLAALVDRGRRELPIQPDYVGIQVQTTASESVRVVLRERRP
jgi:pyrimidine operon attenuation protein/uracil phosphoribosyltransferase